MDKIYWTINQLKADGVSDLSIAKWLYSINYNPETAFWLIDKAAEVRQAK